MNRLALAFVLLAAVPALAQDRAILVLGDDGGLPPAEARGIRSVTATALQQHGVAVVSDRSTEGVHPVDDELAGLAVSLGAQRVFVLRIGGRLGQKVPLTLDELEGRTLEPVYSASLTAGSIEECDVVAGRLAAAVVARRSPESTATMRTVTADESRPFAKKPGERYFFIGLPIPVYQGRTDNAPFGLSLGYGYEAEYFRIEASAAVFTRGSETAGDIVLSAAWIPFATEISPYVGAGLGYMGAGSHGGMGAQFEVGLEAFRLHGVRLLAGAMFLVPFFDTGVDDASGIRHRDWYPAAFVRFGF